MATDLLSLRNLLYHLIEQQNAEGLNAFFEAHYPADVADLLQELDEDKQVTAVRLVDPELAARVLAEIDPNDQLDLVNALPDEEVARIVAALSPDDAADVLAMLTEQRTNQILSCIDDRPFVEDLQELLAYDPDSAGGIMSTNFLSLSGHMTMEEALAYVRGAAVENPETIYYLYVVNVHGVLQGVLSMRELITAPPNSTVGQNLTPEVLSVRTADPKEEAADLIARYDLIAVPVVDRFGHLRGIVTVDDVVDVLEDRATRDAYEASGISGEAEEEELLTGPIREAVKARLPWLVVTFFGGMVAVSVVNAFQGTIEAVTASAFFMPLLAGMGGNVGTQSSTIIVRALSAGRVTPSESLGLILREARLGALIGAILGSSVALVGWLWQGSIRLGLVVGLALLANMTTAATMGTLIPMLFKRLKIDPAVASAPFISTAIDIVGLTIYFVLATLLLITV